MASSLVKFSPVPLVSHCHTVSQKHHYKKLKGKGVSTGRKGRKTKERETETSRLLPQFHKMSCLTASAGTANELYQRQKEQSSYTYQKIKELSGICLSNTYKRFISHFQVPCVIYTQQEKIQHTKTFIRQYSEQPAIFCPFYYLVYTSKTQQGVLQSRENV